MGKDVISKPLISIIIPIYNKEKYLVQCIESILNQSFKEIELILVNDGSTDKSGGICDSFARIDSRVKVIHQSNHGVSNARERGFLLSLGKYIGFVDGDDYIALDMYEKLYNLIIKYDADISSCQHFLLETEKNAPEEVKKDLIGGTKIISNIEALSILFSQQNKMDKVISVVLWDKLFNRRLFEKSEYYKSKEKIPFHYFEDMVITPLLLYHSERIAITEKALYYYRILENSLFRNKCSLYKMYIYKTYKANLNFLSSIEGLGLYRVYLKIYGNSLIKTWFFKKDWLPKDKADEINNDVLREYKLVFKSLIKEADCKLIYKISFIIFGISPSLWLALAKMFAATHIDGKV